MAVGSGRRVAPPLEHRILMTATLCLLAFGAVMVYSASSPIGVLNGGGSGTAVFLRYLIFGAAGLVGMHVLERRGCRKRRSAPANQAIHPAEPRPQPGIVRHPVRRSASLPTA